MNKQERKTRCFLLCLLTFVVLCEILVTLSYERGVLAVQHYTLPVSFAFLGMMVLSGKVKLTVDERVALAYPVWYIFSRFLLKELYLDDSFYPFASMCLVYCFAFPFAHWADDAQRKNGLRMAAGLFGGVYGILAWLGVYAGLSKQNIILPYLETTLSLDEKRLTMSTHPNVTACIFVMALVLLVWLLLENRSRVVRALCAAGILGLYLGIGLTDSRTVMMQVACTAAVVTVLACLRLPIRSKIGRYALALAAGCVALALVFASFSAAIVGLTEMTLLRKAEAESITVSRDFWQDLSSMTGRTDIYKSALQLIKDHPSVLLRGLRESKYVSLQNDYQIPSHTHNAWLQAVIMMGIPGLMFALWFTVATVRLAWAAVFQCKSGTSIADQFLLAAPAVLLINGIAECYVFTELKPYYNFVFFLLLGYAFETWRRMRLKKGEE